jgi:hypothetical protein
MVVAGQSNATSTGGALYVPHNPNILSIDLDSGRVVNAVEPLAGTFGQGTTFLLRLADKLLDENPGRWSALVVAPIAVPSSYAYQWAAGGDLNWRLGAIANKLQAAGISTAFTLWQHGEAEASLPDITQAQYMARVTSVRETLAAAGINAPFFVPLETWCFGLPVSSSTVRAAQTAMRDGIHFFGGPDFDTLGNDYRSDGCHFAAAKGLPTVASMWASTIHAYLALY